MAVLVRIQLGIFQHFFSYTKFGVNEIEPLVITVINRLHTAVLTPETILKNSVIILL